MDQRRPAAMGRRPERCRYFTCETSLAVDICAAS